MDLDEAGSVEIAPVLDRNLDQRPKAWVFWRSSGDGQAAVVFALRRGPGRAFGGPPSGCPEADGSGGRRVVEPMGRATSGFRQVLRVVLRYPLYKGHVEVTKQHGCCIYPLIRGILK